MQPLARRVDAAAQVEVDETRHLAQRQHLLVRHGGTLLEVE